MNMLRILVPPLVTVPVTFVLIVPMLLAALVRVAVPIESWRRFCRHVARRIAELWVGITVRMFRACYDTRHEVTGDLDVDRTQSYLLVANHLSWVDVLILLEAFDGRVPFYHFFLKKPLIWLPLIGLACWALDYPFLKLYTREYLERHPEKRGEDLETARAACERIRGLPATVVTFPEGRLFTPERHRRSKPPYRHLLRPRAGGTSLVLSAMGDRLDALLDVTIHYPDGAPRLGQFLANRVPRVRVHVRQRAIPSAMTRGDYQSDPAFRAQFREWLNEIWREKDELLEEMKSED